MTGTDGPVPPVPGAPAEPADTTPTLESQVPDWEAERRALIDLLVYAWDRARSPGVWERLAAGLEQVGVSVLRPDGEGFDPARHEVGGVEPTTDQDRHDTVAETELAGFSDRGRVVREPIVVIYRRAVG